MTTLTLTAAEIADLHPSTYQLLVDLFVEKAEEAGVDLVEDDELVLDEFVITVNIINA